MPASLDHTVVLSHDKHASARFLSEVMGLPAPVTYGPFEAVSTGNGVSLDFADAGGAEFTPQHYAFLVTEDEFDQTFGRIIERDLDHWADPRKARPSEISTHHGRGCYFDDPSGHHLEIITKTYERW